MKAVVIRKFGTSEVLEIETVNRPIISNDQVLIHVFYSSANPIDWKIRNGALRFITGSKFPMLLGFDVAGEIAETGASVTKFKKGDRVFAMLDLKHRGAYAEYACARENTVALIPENVDFKEAAAIPLTALAAYQALHHKCRIKSGETVLINGASGGVGSFAIQIAKATGANVTAVCSTRNTELVRSLGADKVIDYTKQNFTQLPDRYDIIFDTAGKLSFFRISKNLTSSGRYITTLPNKPTDVLSFFLTPFLSLFGYRKKSTFLNVKSSGSDLNNIAHLIRQKKVIPLIDRVYNLEEIKEAHTYSETGHARGKIVIKIL
ncbi:MAG: hypothetical protein A2X87_02210 [Deltaproteobacteria bacterium GWC2_42_51]|nr:MAG: hypothetical protein A2056_03225 [Deltaproteobacteria bacterium GWA2_42_85]OGP35897.1 MAG: hypothetical protein A2X87_02210 [Deltaproteobacteria bacterium GWC2_42_51]OGP45937.1 MAG: hypothetical protein A2022_08080 [Deltaproteobacteria bacterium GWF2_42_12]OGQ24961.1 MAG: hypothetical protein A3D29_04075 [Deltaproteobacteria bacterium RIFCSPHIGHO2_02_FULL_42_44]OGQ37074.1 MAG: hypothetical protein A3H47_01400 [Deltaproteobacteria bacterium RIFCSPLOWO2_02_FULL_42_39]OGQ66718.1 MAG: hypo